MKIKTTSLKKKRIFAIVALIMALLLAMGLLYYIKSIPFLKSTPTPTSQGPTKQQSNEAAKIDAERKANLLDSSQQAQPAPIPTDSDAISISAQQSGSDVTITTRLNGFADGNCTLFITNKDKTLTQSAKIIYQPSYSTCAGFSVPATQLGAGTWSINLSATPSGGSALQKTITYRVQ